VTIALVKPPPAVETQERLTPRERLESLCDEGSFHALRTGVISARTGDRAVPGDGVLAGAGAVGGRPVFCYSEDPSFMGGSLGAAHAETIVRVMQLAGQSGTPVVSFVESGGARLQEGHASLAGYGRIFRESVLLSRRVPQVTVVSGISAGGGAYSPALTDFVVMTDRARMFLTGPRVVREALGEEVSMEELGGPRVHERNGVCQLVASSSGTSQALSAESRRCSRRRLRRRPIPRSRCPLRHGASTTSAR
jgi:acetyl-CoA carboxylase carboxyltransferase component